MDTGQLGQDMIKCQFKTPWVMIVNSWGIENLRMTYSTRKENNAMTTHFVLKSDWLFHTMATARTYICRSVMMLTAALYMCIGPMAGQSEEDNALQG